VGTSGASYISYHDITNTALKYATNVSGAWVASTLDSMGSIVEDAYTSIAVGTSGAVYISYYVPANGDLKYAANPTHTAVTGAASGVILIRFQTLNKYTILPSEIKTLKGGHSHETYRCCWPFETGRDKGANAIFRKSPAISTMASNLYYSYQTT
jgi:hypothetical protein